MDEKSFWLLIDESQDKARGETSSDRADDQAMHLTEILKSLPPDEIREFDLIFRRFHAQAYRYDIWGAAYLVQGGCSDDAFDYFRAWLIAQGDGAFRRVLDDPETLMEFALNEPDPRDVILEAERMLYAAADAWREITGEEELPDPDFEHPTEPEGKPWEEEDLRELFPKLFEKFGWED
jgi:hypothetical protein